jgi:hypothetical protein
MHATTAAPPGPRGTVAPLTIGSVVVDPPVLQAPMAGYTNYAYRQVVRECGGAGLLATELGHALHRALELLPAGADDDTVLAALHAFEIDDTQRRAALARARGVMALAPLAPAFERAAPAAC